MSETRSKKKLVHRLFDFEKTSSDNQSMNLMIISFLGVVFFCLCCLKLMQALTTRIPVFNHSGFAKAALRVERGYRIAAWSMMTLFFLSVLVVSFSQVFTELPY